MTRKTKPTIADRVAALEQRLSVVENVAPSAPKVASIGASWAQCQALAQQRRAKHDAVVRKFFP